MGGGRKWKRVRHMLWNWETDKERQRKRAKERAREEVRERGGWGISLALRPAARETATEKDW